MTLDGTLAQFCMAVLALSTVALHVARKNRNEAFMYGLQSLSVVGLLVASVVGASSVSVPLLIIVALTFLVKVVLAPIFFVRLVNRHELKFAASTYANVPETLAVIVGILVLAGSSLFTPLTSIVPGNQEFLVIALAVMLGSILLMVNRKGALSQVVGVLSLENSIVAFAILAGLEQSAALQAGVIFDVSVWVIVAVTMVSLVYRHHGSLDISKMKKLRDH